MLYYNYVLTTLISYLAKHDLAHTRLTENSKFYLDEMKRIHFDEFAFKKKVFSYIIKEEKDELAFSIEARYINKSIRVNTKVNEEKKASFYVLTRNAFDEFNEKEIKNILEKKKESYSNVILLTLNNYERNYDSVMSLSMYKNNQDELMNYLISSLSMLFEVDKNIFTSKCPVCGKESVEYEGVNYICSNCHASFALIESGKNELLWIKSFRRN